MTKIKFKTLDQKTFELEVEDSLSVFCMCLLLDWASQAADPRLAGP
jgi:hypothetical protein